MSSYQTHDFRDLPSVINTASPSMLVRTLDFLAGPLALAAAALTFFMAYELTVALPTGLLAVAEPALSRVVPASPELPAQVHARHAGDGPGLLSAQANPQTISVVEGANSKAVVTR
jgi:hypothetical protein